MPIDFTTYRDPGVYVEAITPSSISTDNITPTLVALVGEAPTYQEGHESWALSRSSVIQLTAKGIDPSSVSCASIRTREQFASGAIGTLDEGIADDDDTATITLFDNVSLPETFKILINDEIIEVSGVTGSEFALETRGDDGSTAAAHAANSVVNLYEEYAQGSNLGTLNFPLSAAETQFSVTSTESLTTDTYIEVDGERMFLTTATAGTGVNEQILTVVRGVSGTRATTHGTSNFFATSGAHFFLKRNVGEDETLATTDDRMSIGIIGESIADAEFVDVYFLKSDEEKFMPTLVDRMDAVIEKYGAPFLASGGVNSPLALGAQMAFANGAQRLVLLQVEADDTDWSEAIDVLERETSVTTVVPLTDDDTILRAFAANANQLASQSVLRRTIMGYDGVTQTLTSAAFVAAATSFYDDRVTVVSPGKFTVVTGRASRQITDVPGFYAAAALAGLHASLSPQEPLTRKQLYGISSIPNQDSLTNIITQQSKGVTVIYQDRLGRIIVKHGLTTNTSNLYTKEISIVVSRDRLQSYIEDTLNRGNLVGSAMTSRTPTLILGAVTGALETAMAQGLINDYSNVMYRVPESNPTVVEVRFMYKPILPLNYIYVQFTLDTATGSLEFTTVNN